MNCVILQPSYIPWRGYFHQIQKADVFVFYDDVQYDDRGWRNRNRIKTPVGAQWITIPVQARGCQVDKTPIMEIDVCMDQPWQRKHWRTIERNYRKAPFFHEFAPWVESFYTRPVGRLADYTIETTVEITRQLGITHTKFVVSSSLQVGGGKTERLLGLLRKVGADHYITGPSARTYIDEALLAKSGITIEYMNYNYGEYPQLYPPFDSKVSVLDLLFMVGPDAGRCIWGVGEEDQVSPQNNNDGNAATNKVE